jgi:hypothetical protein
MRPPNHSPNRSKEAFARGRSLAQPVRLGPLAAFAITLALPVLSGCAALGLPAPAGLTGAIAAPSVAFQGATLVQAPSTAQFAAYYCPDLVSVPLGGAGLLCQGFFGARPDPMAMAVAFDAHLTVSNPNQVPLPVSSILAAVTLFPGAGNQKLGATCLHLCPPGAAGCASGGPESANACQASSSDIHSLSDYAAAAAPLLLAAGLADKPGQIPTQLAPQLAAASQLAVVARMSFTPAELLAVLRTVAGQAEGELKAGRAPTFVIPYRIEGTIWFDAGAAGRVAANYGPVEGTFTLPVQGLLAN